MRNENARRRRKAMAVSVAVLAVRSAGPAFAQVTEIYEQNDNGQFAYNTYDSSGNATPHYYPTDNNWNQAAVDAVSGGLGFDGMQTGVVQTQLSNWNTSYYPGQTVPAYSYTLNNVTYYGPVDPTPTTDNIIIPGGNSVNDNAGNLTMASLNLGTGAAVAVNGGQSFTITGNLINDGTLVINNTNVNSPTIITIGGTLSGTGDIVLQHGGSYAQLNGTLTQPSGHSITGFGTINAALTNQGTVNANVSGQTLIMPTNASNSGLFEATGGGILLISGITVTQSGAGVTSANASNVTFTNATLTGGAVSSSNSGTIYISGTNTFSAITSTAAINIPSGNTLNITGNLVDNGTILINSDNGNANAILNISGGTVSGTGTFVLNHYGYGQLNGSLTQSAGHTIDGFGIVNAALINNGVLNANSNGNGITLQSSNMSNNATFEATGGSSLTITGIAVNQSGGGITSANASTVTFVNATLAGGTLSSPASGAVNINGTSTFNALTSSASVNIPSSSTLNITGNLVDNGTILINSDNGNGNAILNISGGTVSGTGTFILNHGIYGQLNGALTQSAGHTIDGFGVVNAALVNNGLLNASIGGTAITLQTSNMSNNSIFEATGGGTLAINGITVTQGAAGSINASTNSVVTLTNANIINSTLTSSPNTANASSPSNAGNVYAYGISSLSNVSNSAYINIPSGNTLNITGNLVDNGTIVVNSDTGNSAAIVNISGGTVSGTGTFILNHPGGYAQLNGVLTQSAGHAINGFGEINAVLINNGLVNASVNGQTLYIESPSLINNSLMESTNGATLYFDSSVAVNNSAGAINASGGGIALTNGASITGGTLNSVSPDVFTVYNLNTTAGYSANLTALNLSTGSQINLQSGNTLSIKGPTFRNNGLIDVNYDNGNSEALLQFNSNTLLTGSGSIYLQHGGSYSVVGTAPGVTLTQDVNHTIYGTGQVTALLVNNGTVNANIGGNTLQLLNSNMSNTGTFEATAGGTLLINGITVTQSGAGVTASNASNVTFANADLSGGLLSSPGSGNVYINGTSTFNALTSTAAVNIPSSNTLNITGNLVDNGTILINSDNGNGNAILNISGGIVSGTGTFILNHGIYGQLNGALTQSAGHTIDGFGIVNAALINNGLLDANSAGNAITLQTSNMTNNAIFEATGGSYLTINGITVTQSAGGLTSANASTVTFFNATLSGGLLASPASGSVTINGTSTFNALTSSASVNIPSNNTLNITGNLVDNGTILINSDNGNNNAVLNISGGTVSGTGTFILNHYGYSQLNGALTQSAGHTINGYGVVNAALINNGLLDANSVGNAITLQSSNMTNNATFEATGGSYLTISGITVNQSGGGITAANASTVTLVNATLSGGTLSSPASGTVDINGTSTFNALTNSASVNIPSSNTLNITGNLVDNGTILINSDNGNNNAILNVSGGTVSGTGTFILNHYSYGQLNGSLTQSAGHTIDGFGNVNATLVNNGLVNANTNGLTLYLGATTTGAGVFQASSGGILLVGANVTISAPGSLLGAGGASSIAINGGASLTDNGSVAGLPAITDNGSFTLGANPGSGIYVRSLYSLTINGGTANIVSSSSKSNRTLLAASSLSFAGNPNNWSGLLDLGNSDMDVAGGSLGNITNQISEGYKGGSWQGAGGITSSAAASASSHLFTLGVIQNNQNGTPIYTSGNQFDGTTPGASDILVKYTYYGDTNLDGKVDGSDYSRIDNGHLLNLTGWYNGDFNYDGVINGSDYTLIDNAYNLQGASLAAEMSASPDAIAAAAIAEAGAAPVPEPGVISMTGLLAVGLLRRRSRR